MSRIALEDRQPRPQGLLAFQNGGGSGEDPGTRLCLNNTVQKDSRGVLGTTFRFGRLSENSRQISNMED